MAKTIFYSLAALVRKILFCHSKIKFISSRHLVISSIYSFKFKPPKFYVNFANVVFDLNCEILFNLPGASSANFTVSGDISSVSTLCCFGVIHIGAKYGRKYQRTSERSFLAFVFALHQYIEPCCEFQSFNSVSSADHQ